MENNMKTLKVLILAIFCCGFATASFACGCGKVSVAHQNTIR
jgi:hypothetical protein